MSELFLIINLLGIGAFVGIFAGLLGVGGGGILVPVLTYIFIKIGASEEQVVHLALGTSMACIIVTSTSSAFAHNKKGAINWRLVRVMSTGVILGSFLATYIASYLNSLYLTVVFSSFMFWTSLKMLKHEGNMNQHQRLDFKGLFFASNGIGAMSSLVSIGGGSLTVPYLVKRSIDMKMAIGTSAAIGLPISIAATLGFLINGWGKEVELENSIGFIYWPAVVLISLTSALFAPLGAKAANLLPASVLKRSFAGLLVLLSIKMAWVVL